MVGKKQATANKVTHIQKEMAINIQVEKQGLYLFPKRK
jgi:hypothetical protein